MELKMMDEYDSGDIFDCETYEDMVKLEIEDMKRFYGVKEKKRDNGYSLDRKWSDYEMDVYL